MCHFYSLDSKQQTCSEESDPPLLRLNVCIASVRTVTTVTKHNLSLVLQPHLHILNIFHLWLNSSYRVQTTTSFRCKHCLYIYFFISMVQTFSMTCPSSSRLLLRSLLEYMLKSSTIILSISFSISHSCEPRCLQGGDRRRHRVQRPHSEYTEYFTMGLVFKMTYIDMKLCEKYSDQKWCVF